MDTDMSELGEVSDLQTRNQKLERSNKAMGLLLEMLHVIQGVDDLETVLRIILTCVTSGYALGFNRAFLFLLEEDGRSLHGALAVGPRNVEEAREIWKDIEQRTESLEDIVHSSRMGGREGDRELTDLVRDIRIKIGDGTSLLEKCLHNNEPVVVDRSCLAESDVLRTLNSNRFVCVPILTAGKPIGLIVADNLITGEPPTEEQVSLFRAFAYQVGQVISHTTHHEEIERRLQELSTLNEVGKGILSTTELETDLMLIARISAQVLNARGAVLRLLDDESGELATKAVYRSNASETEGGALEGGQAIAEKVAAEGLPVLLPDTSGFEETDSELAKRKNLICVPLAKGDRVIGTLTVFDKAPVERLGEEGFNKDDLGFLTVLAGQAAIAIENAKLFDSLMQKERRIGELHTHLLRSERLAALGELSSQVAHEIRNPLAAIGGFARSIERRMAQDDQDRAPIEIIVKETERLERILTEQLRFAKLSPPELRPEDLNEVIRETVNLFKEKIKAKAAALEANLADDIPMLDIDADKMKQVFINVLQNAIDTIPDGGTIAIQTSRRDRTVEIRFANNGPPIPEDILERLFVPFATTKATGSGLGLPIAYEIVYEHGGVIDVKSGEDTGTVFLITLPLTVEGERRRGPIDRRGSIRDRRKFGRVP